LQQNRREEVVVGAAGTLLQGLESWDSVGDRSLLVSLLTCITITHVFWNLFAYL